MIDILESKLLQITANSAFYNYFFRAAKILTFLEE